MALRRCSSNTPTVYPKKYAHGFCFAVLCCGYTLTDCPISIRLTSLALWQSNDCPSASKATLMNMDKYFMWIHYERLHNHNKTKHNKTVCIFLGIYCISHLCDSCIRRSVSLPHLSVHQSKEGVVCRCNTHKHTANSEACPVGRHNSDDVTNTPTLRDMFAGSNSLSTIDEHLNSATKAYPIENLISNQLKT